jgi:RNA polymerase sigma-70 factor, ECF subfamily
VTALRPGNLTSTADTAPVAEADDWVELLTTTGPAREDALRRLHMLLLRAARRQVSRMQSMLAAVGADRVDEIVNQAADEAMVALLGKLSTFEGRSRFTTWAYKFAIFHAAVEVRRHVWLGREIPLQESPEPWALGPTPEEYTEAAALSRAVAHGIENVLTRHQRRIVIAVLLDDVPIDVLADRLGTSRNALYKTLHDARQRLRAHLTATGYLATTPSITPSLPTSITPLMTNSLEWPQ